LPARPQQPLFRRVVSIEHAYQVTLEEEHSTRGRARLLFEMLDGHNDGAIADRWRSEAVRDALDLCLACKGCKAACPVNVDMATYKAEFLSHHLRAGAWDDALAAGRPAVVEFVTDPEVPPLPPRITMEQAKQLAQTIRKGDPAAPHFTRQALRGKLAEFLTR
jgi:Fe-S oxidoreductase